MKIIEEHQCFLMSPFSMGLLWWMQLSLNLFQHFHFYWYMVRHTKRQTHVPPNVKRSTKLWGVQCSSESAFRSTDFYVPEKLIFPAQEARNFRRWVFACLLFLSPRIKQHKILHAKYKYKVIVQNTTIIIYYHIMY